MSGFQQNVTRHAKKIGKTNKSKSWFFEQINTINKPVTRLIKRKKKEDIQIASIRNERGAITTDPIDTKRIIKE